MEKPQPKFEDSYRITDSAKERGSKMMYSERYHFERMQDVRKDRASMEMEKIDKIMIDFAQFQVANYLSERHPDHVVKPPAESVMGDRTYSSPHVGITINRVENSSYGDARLILDTMHEEVHSQSFLDLAVGEKVAVSRLGLQINSNTGEVNTSIYFKGLNEAITSMMEKSIFRDMPDGEAHKNAILERVSAITEDELSPVVLRAIKAFPSYVSLTETEGKNGEEPRKRITTSYFRDNLLLAALGGRIAVTAPDKYTYTNDALIMLERAALSGDLKDMKQAVNTALGPQGMIVLSRWSPMEQSYTVELQERLMNFIKGDREGVQQLIEDLTVFRCKNCGTNSGGQVCIRCEQPRNKKEKKEQPALECKFCGEPTDGGPCSDCAPRDLDDEQTDPTAEISSPSCKVCGNEPIVSGVCTVCGSEQS